jgi:glycerol uptake facilitator-like aquaporin
VAAAPNLARKAAAEALGTAFLLAVVIGSGIMRIAIAHLANIGLWKTRKGSLSSASARSEMT